MNNYYDIKFREVNPLDYAMKLKIEFEKNPQLWFDVIIPKSAADRLKQQCNGDYSLIWHVHCDMCFTHIDKDSDVSYVSEDDITWLCKECYEKIR